MSLVMPDGSRTVPLDSPGVGRAPGRPPAPQGGSVRQEILDALLDLYPDQPPTELSRIADSLAKEYESERVAALKELGPRQEQPPMVPQDYQGEWRWDGSKPVPVTDEYRASQRESQKRRAQEQNESLARAEAARKYNYRDSKGGPVGPPKIGPVMPGDAQPIQPSTGTRYGEPDAPPEKERSREEMYWRLVESGMKPFDASIAVSQAFQHAPKTYKPPEKPRPWNSPIRFPPGGSLQPMEGRSPPDQMQAAGGVRNFPAIGRGLGGPMTPDQMQAAKEDEQFRYGMRKERALSGLM